MAEKRKNIIRNPKFRDSSSKLIFGDHILSFQFLRDYADMDILRKIRPEDVEDVSERYVPLYSTKRETEDAVAKIKERKMGRLFENITMDIQAERRKNAETQGALKAAQQEVDIYRHISKMLRRNHSEAEIRESLVKSFGLTEARAADVLRRALEE